MSIEHIVVDGSNIATEGRSLPSLKQLEEAVTELRRDHPDAEITVIVDATFAHRIDPAELPHFEEAVLRGEYVHPPAGAIGRGDAFLLRVAEKVDGTVLSNDSFQEFHGEHPWLFERGRLLGGTPVPGIGWIFSPRQPVRGPRSRQAVRETSQAKKRVTKAIAVATKEVVKPGGQSPAPAASNGRSRRRRGGSASASERAAAEARDGAKPTPLAVNDPLAFISFIAEHSLGKELEGEVEGYTSHGAVVRVGDMLCYVPLANLGHPPPRSAREVLKRHERATFVLTALDPQRRGAELALPGIARVSGHPSKETVDAEVRLAKSPQKRAAGSGPRRSELGKPPVPTAATPPPGRRPAGRGAADAPAVEAPAAPAATALPAPAAPAPSAEVPKAPAKKAPAKKAAKKAAAKKGPAKEGPLKEGPAKEAAAKKAAAKKAPPAAGRAAKKTAAKPVPAKSSAAKKVSSPRQGSREQAAPAKKADGPAPTKARRRAPKSAVTKKAAAGSAAAAPSDSSGEEPQKSPSGRRSPRAVKSSATGRRPSR